MSKKLVIEKVAFGKVPYGPGNGDSSLAVFVKEVDGEYDYESPKTEDGKVTPPEQVAAAGLFKDIVNLIQETKLEDRWSEVLLAKNYLYMVGDEMAAPAHREVTLALMALVDTCALEIQKKLISQTIPEGSDFQSQVMKRLASPLTVFVCQPTNFTGTADMYQAFRIIVCKYPLGKDPMFNQMACVEIGRHPFGVVIFDVKDAKNELATIKETYQGIEAVCVPNQRVFVVDHTGDKDVAQFAIDSGYRLNRALDYGDLILQF